MAMWRTPDLERRMGGVSYVSVFVDPLCECVYVCVRVCLLLPVYLCVCFDISVSYRAAQSEGTKRKRIGLKVFIITAFLQWREGRGLGCKSGCLSPCLRACLCAGAHLCLCLALSLSYFAVKASECEA